MARKETKSVTITCDRCGNEVQNDDDLALIGERVPILVDETVYEGGAVNEKRRWAFTKSDLCASCAMKLFRARAAMTVTCQGEETERA